MRSHALISTFAKEAAIPVCRHRVGLDRPINVSESSGLLIRLRALSTHFSFQYWNKGPVFVNSLLRRGCRHCSKRSGEGCVQKETGSVGTPCSCQWEAWPCSQVLLLGSFAPDLLLKIKSLGGRNQAPPALHCLSGCQGCTTGFGVLVLFCSSAKC